ncbi:multidrug efflux transporter transcriptional repressor AcrR [Morganella psychrotolerans]|uniref:Multidrug efflux transporter transcriptional repressor AcrR n=1 Tax=Morganella psychrotolerans TaxID=368603 RepID=A0A5M9QYQ5_9GAMM|nr:multidrug efflux transporter transcriptional repressor AcrR [Morganella psychrotolerans]KAA8713510.1 multidrug efflux transporter transcriptional repressor AcrR [Morganella psychrotolerans]OBU02810.1 DNA-binding transcriptional repressor AcrR [Morganella psychrotolerans]
MARKTKQQALETRQQIIDAALIAFSEQGVSSTSLVDIAKQAGVTRGAIYWHFKNKVDLFTEVCAITDTKIGLIEQEYRAKHPDNPLLVFKKILIYILKSAALDPKMRAIMSMSFHKCEFTGEMSELIAIRQNLYAAEYSRIEVYLIESVAQGFLPATLDLRRAAIMLRGMITGLLENWLFSNESFNIVGQAEYLVDGYLDMLMLSNNMQLPPADA